MTDLVIKFKFEEYRKFVVDGYSFEFTPLYETEPNYGTHLTGSLVLVTRNEDGDTMFGIINASNSNVNITKIFNNNLERFDGQVGNRKVHDDMLLFLKDGLLSIQIKEVDDGCKYCVL